MKDLNRKNSTNRSKLAKELEIMLGGQLVDVELDKASYDLAIDLAIEYYRQRSSNAVEESYLFIMLSKATNDYVLPEEVTEVRKIYRKSFGAITASSDGSDTSSVDPFDVAYTNMLYMMDLSSGGLATYDISRQNLELAGRLFGEELLYSWNEATKRLKIVRNLRSDEEVLLWIYNYIPEEDLLKNTYARPWLRRYALAQAKIMLGRAYRKFGNLAGPQGGVSMNASELINEAMTDLAELEDSLKKYGDGGTPLSFIMG